VRNPAQVVNNYWEAKSKVNKAITKNDPQQY
jgi:hypothetical protein